MRMKTSEELARQHTASYSTHMLTPLFLGKLDHKVEVGSTSFLHRYTFTHPSAFLSLGQVQLILKDSVMETVHLMTPSWVGCPYFMLSQHVLLYLSLSLSSSLQTPWGQEGICISNALYSFKHKVQLSSVTHSCLASLSITNSWSLLKSMPIELVMPSNHLILCMPLLLPPSIFPSIRVFSNESALHIRQPKDWGFSFKISWSSRCRQILFDCT